MSQHDMTVDNGAGLAVRADLNLALKALASQSSGSSAPSTTYPLQVWGDTGTGRLKQRNSANTTWIDRGPLDSAMTTRAAYGITDAAGATDAPGLRNKLINSAFSINQRAYVSGAATSSANQYTLDRWAVVVSGQSLAFAASGPGFIVTAPAGGIEQIIEAGIIDGGIYTLSWVGTATATVNGVAITNGGNTSSLAGNTAVTIRFTGGTVSKAQFEPGTQATLYESRSPWLEMAMCMRYYQRLNNYLREVTWSGSTSTGYSLYRAIGLMRATPTVSASGLSVVGATSISCTGASPNSISFNFTSNIVGNIVVSYAVLSLDAEL